MDARDNELVTFCKGQNFDLKVKEKYRMMKEEEAEEAIFDWFGMSAWVFDDKDLGESETMMKYVFHRKKERKEAIEKIKGGLKDSDSHKLLYVGLYNDEYNGVILQLNQHKEAKVTYITLLCRAGNMEYMNMMLNKILA